MTNEQLAERAVTVENSIVYIQGQPFALGQLGETLRRAVRDEIEFTLDDYPEFDLEQAIEYAKGKIQNNIERWKNIYKFVRFVTQSDVDELTAPNIQIDGSILATRNGFDYLKNRPIIAEIHYIIYDDEHDGWALA